MHLSRAIFTYSVSKLEASLGIINVVVSFQKFLCLIEQISTMLTATSKVTMCAMLLLVIFSFKSIARDTSGMFWSLAQGYLQLDAGHFFKTTVRESAIIVEQGVVSCSVWESNNSSQIPVSPAIFPQILCPQSWWWITTVLRLIVIVFEFILVFKFYKEIYMLQGNLTAMEQCLREQNKTKQNKKKKIIIIIIIIICQGGTWVW